MSVGVVCRVERIPAHLGSRDATFARVPCIGECVVDFDGTSYEVRAVYHSMDSRQKTLVRIA